MAVAGAILALYQRKYAVLALILIILVNMLGAGLIRGKERARLLAEPYLLIMSAHFLIAMFYWLSAALRGRENLAAKNIQNPGQGV
jgi:hypothetical protein